MWGRRVLEPLETSVAPHRGPALERLAEFRRRTLDLLLLLTFLAGLVSVLLLTPASWREQRWAFLVTSWTSVVVLGALAALRGLPYRARAWPFVLLELGVFAVDLPHGMTVVTATTAAVPAIFAAILLGAGAGLACLAVVIALIVTVPLLPPGVLGAITIAPAAPVAAELAAALGLLPLLGAVVGIGIVVRGMARAFDEQRSLVRTLEANEQKFRGIFEASPDAIAVLTRPGYRFLDVNRRFEALFGWTASELVGRSLQDVGMVRVADLPLLEARLATDPVLDGIAQTAHRRDGADLAVEVALRSFELSGQPVVLAILRDVTSQRRLETALQQAQRVEAIGAIAGGVAHNFRNALGAILPNLDYCLAEAPPALREPLQDARSAASSAVDLASRLTRMANRDGEGQGAGPVDLRAVLADVVGICRSSFGARVAVAGDLDADGLVQADRGQLHQMFLNLCLNARDAVEGLGTPWIQVGLTRSDDDRMLVATVADNGHGMDAATLQRVGEPFFTTKGEGRGTGLGLSTAFATVREAGGRISVASKVGQGTTFTIELPLFRGPAAPAEAPARALRRGARVLAVDDDPLLLEALGRQLASLGLEVETVAEPVAALARVRADPRAFQLLITDLDMPELSGRELAARAREVAPWLPIVILSGTAHEPVAEAAGVLAKPVRTADLATVISRCLGIDDPAASHPA